MSFSNQNSNFQIYTLKNLYAFCRNNVISSEHYNLPLQPIIEEKADKRLSQKSEEFKPERKNQECSFSIDSSAETSENNIQSDSPKLQPEKYYLITDFQQAQISNQNNNKSQELEFKSMEQDLFDQMQMIFSVQAKMRGKAENEAVWYYIDQRYVIQGPFDSLQMDSWNQSNFFVDNLPISFLEQRNFTLLKILREEIILNEQKKYQKLLEQRIQQFPTSSPKKQILVNENQQEQKEQLLRCQKQYEQKESQKSRHH